MLPIHIAANGIESRLTRAYVRSVEKLREPVSIDELAMKLSARNVKGAIRSVPIERVKDVLTPMANIIQDAVMKGGRLGAKTVNLYGEE